MLINKMMICIGVAIALWVAILLVPAVADIHNGRATGLGFIVPRFLLWLPRAAQIPVTLLGVPLLAGCVAGFFWRMMSHS